jgi:quercetin dioxygenase-like cupin family protein
VDSNGEGELKAAQVFSLVGLVAYQDGAVVSRTLMDKGAGTLTLFAFGAGQGLSEHQAPFDALVYILDGTAAVSVSGENHNLVAGDMIILPANKPHALRATARFKMLLAMIRS